MRKLVFYLTLLFSLNSYGQFDFSKQNSIYQWIGLKKVSNLGRMYYTTALDNAIPIALEQMTKSGTDWKVVKYTNYIYDWGIGYRAWPVFFDKAQYSQVPVKHLDAITAGYAFVQSTKDPKKRLTVQISYSDFRPTSINILFNREDKAHKTLANKFYADLKNLVVKRSIYHGAAVELKHDGRIGFLDGYKFSKLDWKDFIFEKEAKDRVQNSIENFLLKFNLKKWKELGLPLNRGIILHGPPGTGKSLIAKILISNILKKKYNKPVTYIHVQSRHVYSPYAIREIYNLARLTAPSVIFIEDIDLIAGTSRNYYQAIKNELMQQLSGVEKLEGVMTIATSNLFNELDPALKRSKRLGFHYHIGKPKTIERKKLFELFTRKLDKSDLDHDRYADLSEGLTGADIKELVGVAAETALRAKSEKAGKVLIKDVHMTAAFKRFNALKRFK